MSLVLEKLNRLKPGKSPGVDNISTLFLKNVCNEVAEPSSIIFTKSMESGQIPLDWKRANVSPVFKKVKRSSPTNYRPISLTSHVSKVMESIIRDAIMKHLSKYELIRESQHGFMNSRSCLTNLLLFQEKLSKYTDDGYPVDVLYFDFSKAFDRVPHTRLLLKLKAHGIGETLCRWIESWLTEREQRVVVNGKVSEWGSVGSGVAKVSVLGPTAFLVHISDLDIEVKNDILKFADDTKLFAAIRSDEDADRLQDDVSKLYEWSKKWQMNCNVDKCNCVHIGRNNKEHDYYIGDNIVQVSSSGKDLGVIIESTLDWGKQCANVARIGNMMLSQINRSFTYKTGPVIKNLYKSLVRPKFDYCMQAWRPWLQQDVSLLEKVQRRMTRMIPELRQQPYQVRLRKLSLTTLETRRRRADLIEVYRMFNGLDDIESKLFFVSQEGCSTRGHRLKIFKQRARLDVRKYCFSHRVVNDWNNLPARAIESNTLKEFKGYVNKYLRKY